MNYDADSLRDEALRRAQLANGAMDRAASAGRMSDTHVARAQVQAQLAQMYATLSVGARLREGLHGSYDSPANVVDALFRTGPC
jgi:hypothetical protein